MLIRGAGALGMMGFDKWGIFDRERRTGCFTGQARGRNCGYLID